MYITALTMIKGENMEHLCIMIDRECPECGQPCRSIGTINVVGWECPVCEYYDPEYDWLSSEIQEVFEDNMIIEELEFEMEVDNIHVQAQNHSSNNRYES
jgi:uncharacterized Zn finger protein (UPF0148 family)